MIFKWLAGADWTTGRNDYLRCRFDSLPMWLEFMKNGVWWKQKIVASDKIPTRLDFSGCIPVGIN